MKFVCLESFENKQKKLQGILLALLIRLPILGTLVKDLFQNLNLKSARITLQQQRNFCA